MKKRNYIRQDFLNELGLVWLFLGLGFSSIFAVAVTGTLIASPLAH